MSLPRTPENEAALASACAEVGLQSYYVDCVRPLLGVPESQWPACCGGGCEPCAQTLCAVAKRAHDLLGLHFV